MSLCLVTGGAGFIGSNLVARLEAEGWDVVVCDRVGEAASGKWRNLRGRALEELVEPDDLWSFLDRRGRELDLVIHMGAVSSTTEPDADLILRTNFTLSRRLFDWCAEAGVRLLYASSAATYGDGSGGFRDADDLESLKALRPLNPYGWSKALFDVYARRSADRGRAPPQWAGLKFFNVYGPGEGHKGAMASVVAQIWPRIAAGEPVVLFRSHRPEYADGGQMRDFVHVRDVEAATLFLLARPEVSGVFNLGSGQARSFLDLATAAFHAAGREPRIAWRDTPEEIRGAYQYFTEADMTRLRAAGFAAPATVLETGVRDYVQTHLMAAHPLR